MKKMFSLIVAIALLLTVFPACVFAEDLDFTAPAASADSAERAAVADVYVTCQTGVQVSLGQSGMENANEVYVLQLMTDGTYELTITQSDTLYRAPASIVTVCYGTYSAEKLDDETTAVNLSEAAQVIYTAYIGVNKLSVKVDTNDASMFPVGLIGTNDKNMEVADYIAYYGPARTFYTVKGCTNLFLEDPAE